MGISQLSQDELIVQSKQAIGNALADPVIQGYLAEWGYTVARLQEGQALLTKAVQLTDVKVDEFGDQLNATFDKGQAWEEANREYMKLLKVARVAVKRPGDRNKLCLDGEREQSYAGWWQQTNDFYKQALENAEILAQLAEVNLTPVKLQAGQALLNKVDAARAQQTSQKGAAQNVTADRTAALEALQKWMSDYKAIAEVALEDHPQLLESLGWVVRSSPADDAPDGDTPTITPPQTPTP